MKVFKFGGASVKDAEAVKNVYRILQKYSGEELCIIFSAMGKTTNALEKVAEAWWKGTGNGNQSLNAIGGHANDLPGGVAGNADKFAGAVAGNANELLEAVAGYHLEIAANLNIDPGCVHRRVDELKAVINSIPPANYNEAYDRVVSYGELISTAVISRFLSENGFSHKELDARQLIITNDNFRNAGVNWEKTKEAITDVHEGLDADETSGMPGLSGKYHQKTIITQGFIGSSESGKPVTLGREGSDFSAAIFAWALDAEEMIIWKDVPGVLNADPRYFEDTIKLDHLTYRDAIELAYYGASVIHPKTIQPLQSKRIPLFVKSFFRPDEPGSVISAVEEEHTTQIPSFIFKKDQVLISISPRDFSFIAEGNLHNIFGLLASLDIHFNMMQHSAISFSIVIDNNREKMDRLFAALGDDYRVRYNEGLELITIRYYNQETIDKNLKNRKILLEQKSRTTVQLVVESQTYDA